MFPSSLIACAACAGVTPGKIELPGRPSNNRTCTIPFPVSYNTVLASGTSKNGGLPPRDLSLLIGWLVKLGSSNRGPTEIAPCSVPSSALPPSVCNCTTGKPPCTWRSCIRITTSCTKRSTPPDSPKLVPTNDPSSRRIRPRST